MKEVYIFALTVILLISYFALIGFLCWLFKSGWFALMILAAPSVRYNNDQNATQAE